MKDREQAQGAYGLELKGLPERELLVPLESGKWPAVEVDLRPVAGPAGETVIGNDRAIIGLDGDECVLLDRARSSATLVTAPDGDRGRLVHPLLTAVGTVFAWWHGHEAFHGGAFLTPTGAWAVLGDRGQGKSSLLAALAQAGHQVLTDDLLVVGGDVAFAGPRCVDLRDKAIRALGLEAHTEAVRGGDRRRLRLGPIAPTAPLRGWVVLAWGDRVAQRALGTTERLQRLSGQRNIQGVHPDRLVELTGLPGWELRRPRDWRSADVAVETLLDLTS